jgi:hypothetical protein
VKFAHIPGGSTSRSGAEAGFSKKGKKLLNLSQISESEQISS